MDSRAPARDVAIHDVTAEMGIWTVAGLPGSRIGSSEQPARILSHPRAGMQPDPDLHDVIDFQLPVVLSAEISWSIASIPPLCR
jgi:hypothetical protein